ncbi:hypothetical protein DFA_08033 [Cavenderia fasciculata]|uniref:Transmembrane protein n=1 Tax=Cavenderia fasciculata TaxID=261658 RepID=F4Q4P3_CACFS|nr:uncharacterized protein DFA_08033 [Cavenderia fasciculata]EGG17052.1 hypothetical protein DFA_08033 [Cavenderia fasciculata]|eukprot:XP_004355536.1 hypothetical protein DFA_08033 [Cavenderia fasciculata]
MTDISSLSIDKCKELISDGLKSILSTTYSKYDKVLFVGSIALPFLVNLPYFGILPNNRDQRIESFYDNGAIEKIINVYQQVESNINSRDIRDLAEFAERSNKLCRILAKREIVKLLLSIIFSGEDLWRQSYNGQLPLSEETIYQIYTTLDNESLMLDCTDLLNHILPWVNDIPYEGLIYVIKKNVLATSSYRLTCTILKTMILKPETIQPFISVGIITITRYYLDNEFKSEYRLLRDYWLQITQIICKDKDNISLLDQSLIDEYYKMGRFKLLIPKELRINSLGKMLDIVTDGIGFYTGWLNATGLLLDQINTNSYLSNWIYRRLDSTLTRYLLCSAYYSSLTLYLAVFRNKNILYPLASVLSMAICSYQARLVNHQKLGGPIYKAFKKYYQTPLDNSMNNHD